MSHKHKILPFVILLVVILGCTDAKVAEREKVVEMLNKQFDLPTADACAFRFYMERYNDSKVLFAKPCRLLNKTIVKPTDILTPENLPLIKNAEFNKLDISGYGRFEIK